MTDVSREALAGAPPANGRRYHSPKRRRVADEKRAALIEAVLLRIAEGHFKSSAQQLADLAGVRRQAICRYFGSVDLLYRVVARERWAEVIPYLALPCNGITAREAKATVWLVLVGHPRETTAS